MFSLFWATMYVWWTQAKTDNVTCHLHKKSTCESVKKTVYMDDYGPPVSSGFQFYLSFLVLHSTLTFDLVKYDRIFYVCTSGLEKPSFFKEKVIGFSWF